MHRASLPRMCSDSKSVDVEETMNVRICRTLISVLSLITATAGCSATGGSAPPAPPAQARAHKDAIEPGNWRIGGGSDALFSNRDFGSVEQTEIGAEVTAGKVVAENLVVEGIFDLSNADTELDGGADLDQTTFLLGGGVRYYLTTGTSTRPYGRVLGGIAMADIDFGGGVDDDDSSFFLGLGAGAETFFTDHFALDYGLRWIQAFDLFNEELTEIALFIGISVWV